MPKQRLLLMLAAVTFIMAAMTGLYWFRLAKTKVIPTTTPKEETINIPTLSPEQIQLYSQVETKAIVVKASQLTPANLTIKPYDQVAWKNESGQEIEIIGDGWQSPKISADQNYTRAFPSKGEFSYKISPQDSLSGKIIVKARE